MNRTRLANIPCHVKTMARQQLPKIGAAAHRSVRATRGVSTAAVHREIDKIVREARQILSCR